MARGRTTEPVGVGQPHKPDDYPPPPYLGPLAVAKWSEMIPDLLHRNLTRADLDALAQYCSSFVLWARAVKELETADLLSAGPNGAKYMNPLFNVAANLEASVIKNASRIGLDTAGKKRHSVPEPKGKADEFTQFLNKRNGKSLPEVEETE